MRIAFVSTYPPRRCGIATFTSDLIHAIRQADPSTRARIAAIDERNSVRAYGSEVRWRIRQGSPMPYRAAARAINRSNADVVCVQHEFGLYGLWKGGGWVGDHWIEGTYEDHLTPFLDELEKPALVTLHTVLPEPSPAVREAVRSIADSAHGLTVMAETAVDILRDVYGIAERPIVIPHGMPHIEPIGRRRLKAKLGLDHRQIVSTFGLVGPGKGLEYVIEAMPAVVARHPDALYLIAGQTHPELLKQRGEEYRNRLTALVEELGLTDNVVFVNQYLEQKDIIDYLLATDVYVTPYLDPNQITDGTLSYGLGTGKAVVSTPYLHAKEALADERGLLVDFQAADQIADAVNTILDDPKLKGRLEKNAYRYANEATWPKTGARFLDMMQELVAEHPPVQKERRREKPLTVAHRLRGNPLIQNTAGGFTEGQTEFTDYLSHISHLRVARSSDGNHFTIDPEPTIVSATPLEEYGVEDPRITRFGDVFHITYVAVSRFGITTARLTTTDFRSFERHGTMLEPDQKDVVLFPEQVGGRYLALTRPMPGSFGRVLGLWLSESDDLVHWGNPRPIAQPRSGTWDEMRIGASLVPISVDGGLLEIYHGADRDNRYGVGALLLDAGDPTKVLARTDRPLLVPEADYELDGFLHDVVFPSGHVDLGDGDIRVYYGAADTSVCAADMAIDDVLSALDPV